MIVNPYTFQITTRTASLTLTFTRDGHLLTTHEYAGKLVKRVSVVADRSEVIELKAWIEDNLKVEPLPKPKEPPK